jgi:hypothetical protein
LTVLGLITRLPRPGANWLSASAIALTAGRTQALLPLLNRSDYLTLAHPAGAGNAK